MKQQNKFTNKTNWKLVWWFINQALFLYGIHPSHFYRYGWKIKYVRPTSVIVTKHLSISRTQQHLGNEKKLINEARKEFKLNKEKYQSFVSEWLRDEELPLAIQGDSQEYMFVLEGYKRQDDK